MSDKLHVDLRNETGKRRNRRARGAGKIPAILYGHGQDNLRLAVAADELYAAIRHGSRVVDLVGGANEQAFIKECQWDTWGDEVLHVDLTRVSAHEKVEAVVPLELRGEAPGSKEGGGVSLVLHEIELLCKASEIPEKVSVNINHLELDGVIHVSDLELPPSASPAVEPETVVVTCAAPVEKVEEEAEGEAEPEVIGRKQEDEETEAS